MKKYLPYSLLKVSNLWNIQLLLRKLYETYEIVSSLQSAVYRVVRTIPSIFQFVVDKRQFVDQIEQNI